MKWNLYKGLFKYLSYRKVVMKRKGFTLGRFQPFHNEHAKLIEKMKEECDEVYVGILETNFSEHNPFTYEERKEMINGYDSSLNIFPHDKKDIVALGIGLRLEVPFDAVFYSGNKKECAGIAALGFMIDYNKRGNGSATAVRKKLFSGTDEWKEMVPESSRSVIERVMEQKVNGLKTIKKKRGVLGKYDL